MSLSRRHFFACAASAAAAGAFPAWQKARAGEGRVISWPSRVVQLPPDDDDHKPPVITAVRVHRGGQWLATAGDDHHVRVWSLADGKLVHKLASHTDWVRTIDYSPDGRILASAGNDRRIIFWDAVTGAQLDVAATHQHAIAAIRFSHDGQRLAAVGFEEHVRLYDTKKMVLASRLPAPCQDMRAVTF